MKKSKVIISLILVLSLVFSSVIFVFAEKSDVYKEISSSSGTMEIPSNAKILMLDEVTTSTTESKGIEKSSNESDSKEKSGDVSTNTFVFPFPWDDYFGVSTDLSANTKLGSSTAEFNWKISAERPITAYDLMLEIDGWLGLPFSSTNNPPINIIYGQTTDYVGTGSHTATLVGRIYTPNGYANINSTINFVN